MNNNSRLMIYPDKKEKNMETETTYVFKCFTCGKEIKTEEELFKIADKVDSGNCGMRFVPLHCLGCGKEWIQPL